ncbi:MAG: hypothetical protein CMJ19_06595, partial [Phycisphaeraceae bacterium]|nr:hypothetical protein [Phycisphaeraceae bacterium]
HTLESACWVGLFCVRVNYSNWDHFACALPDAHKLSVKPRRGRPAGSKNTVNNGAIGKGKMPTATADTFVLSFIQANPGCTTAQVNEHWITAGRNGKADQTLFKLVKNGQIARKNIKGRRGSMYTIR